MHLALSQDQDDFRAVIVQFLDDKLADGHARAFVDGGGRYDAALWKSLTAELGLAGLAVDEELGGSGAGLVELALVAEEAGRAMLCAPLFATAALAGPAVLAAPPGTGRDTLLARLATGDATATAVLDAGPSLVLDGDRLSGVLDLVVDGATADVLVLAAADADGPALVAVDRDPGTVAARSRDALDPTRPLAWVTLDGAAAAVLARGADAAAALRRGRAVAATLLAAEQLGGLRAALDLAVGHARSRVQFDRPIGGFQAVKHRLADVYVDLELSRWTTYVAAASLAAGGPDAEQEAEAAATRATVSEAFQRSTGALLQVLGGIGYTWEHDAHLLFKRAAASARLLGTVDDALDAVADHLGLA